MVAGPGRGGDGQDAGREGGEAHGEGGDAKQAQGGGHQPDVAALTAEVGREEDGAAAGQHIERIQPVDRLIAKEAGRNVVKLPEA